ncbi:DUF1129 family protein [Radiobacillus deserti]|uniref:DUF1129 domain-containing protein n=1 Tax=Radiobacillus deserti TaxID=2594883 RepID=A0A516KCN5_9BACI|nr:DUF1129 family protein [Radiobacillus deserti]QDP39130.1 DUF1129 domain-containing protein [Radiobacillus deserti]
MNAKELIELNNEKRDRLNEENLAYYEDMLLYMRMSLSRSEQQTEELLMELLDHLLDAQENGKTAKEVFGDDPKSYCKEMIKELPKEKMKDGLVFFIYLACYGLAWVSITSGVLGLFMDPHTVQLGTAIINVLIYALMLIVCVFLIFKVIGWSIFRRMHGVLEYLLYTLIFTLFVGASFLLTKVTPNFGTELTLSSPIYIGIGILLFGISYVLNKIYKITKSIII